MSRNRRRNKLPDRATPALLPFHSIRKLFVVQNKLVRCHLERLLGACYIGVLLMLNHPCPEVVSLWRSQVVPCSVRNAMVPGDDLTTFFLQPAPAVPLDSTAPTALLDAGPVLEGTARSANLATRSAYLLATCPSSSATPTSILKRPAQVRLLSAALLNIQGGSCLVLGPSCN